MESEINPYESPHESAVASPNGGQLRAVFFAINFGTAVAFGLLCITAVVQSIAGDSSPFALMGGVCCLGPTAAIAVGEWFLFVRKRESLRYPLALGCGAVAAFVTFGLVANIFEALTFVHSPDESSKPPGIMFWLIFGSISLTIALYGFFCCWHRLRDHRPLVSRESGGIL